MNNIQFSEDIETTLVIIVHEKHVCCQFIMAVLAPVLIVTKITAQTRVPAGFVTHTTRHDNITLNVSSLQWFSTCHRKSVAVRHVIQMLTFSFTTSSSR